MASLTSCFPTLGCWQSDVYVSKYNIPTTNCATATNDASIFYTNANAIADYDNRLQHILSHKYTDGTPWSQLSVSKWYYWKEDIGRMLMVYTWPHRMVSFPSILRMKPWATWLWQITRYVLWNYEKSLLIIILLVPHTWISDSGGATDLEQSELLQVSSGPFASLQSIFQLHVWLTLFMVNSLAAAASMSAQEVVQTGLTVSTTTTSTAPILI